MKRVVFLTGTRADFGKLKSLIEILLTQPDFECHIFTTGMHMDSKYGRTALEVVKCGYPNIYSFINHNSHDSMDQILAKTIQGFSDYIHEIKPDLILVHGDRTETLAGAIVGALNNILVGHIEGGEVSGTIDELIRHSVTKMSHVHFVANELARRRLVQMGENPDSIFIIGSPDIDIMISKKLPSLATVKKHYEIPFEKYALLMFHPVTTEIDDLASQSKKLVDAILQSGQNVIAIYPNNDMGNEFIINEYGRFAGNPRIRVFPSMRFEYFLVLIKHAQFVIGNSSAGIREAPFYAVPSVNIGSRQHKRASDDQIIHCDHETSSILASMQKAQNLKLSPTQHFGEGNSDRLFLEALRGQAFTKILTQKHFKDLN